MGSTVWKGSIAFGMMTFPIKVTCAARSQAVSLHLIHGECGSRINMVVYCPLCGKVIPKTELVRAYEVEKEKHIQFSDEELESIKPESSRVMEIDDLVDMKEIDPILFDASYYTEPETAGRKPYKLLLAALTKRKKMAIARITMHQREHALIIRPYNGVLMFHTMFYRDEVRTIPVVDTSGVKIKDQELELACKLIDIASNPFDHNKFSDRFREEFEVLLMSKQEGKQFKREQKKEESRPESPDILDILRESIKAKEKTRGAH